MGLGFDKQPASRPNIYQTVTWLTTAGAPGPKVCSSPFGVATQHIRVFSSISGWVSIDQSTSTTVASTATIPSGMFIPASTTTGEYFIVTPGQRLTFFSTGTTTGYINIVEMA